MCSTATDNVTAGLYNELSNEARLSTEILQATDMRVSELASELAEAKNHLDKLPLQSPSQRSIDRILEYAASREKQVQRAV